MSRDWVIDKMTIGVTYDTDLDKAQQDHQADRQGARGGSRSSRPHIIEPLKMQGVEQIGDFAIQIRLKMMTKPGEQFVIRRTRLCADQEGLRGERHPVRRADGAGLRRGRAARPR